MFDTTVARPSRRTILAGGLALGTTLLATACGGSAGQAADNTTLTLWDYYQEPEPTYLKRLSDFTASSGVKIERTFVKYDDFLGKILQGAAAGKLPDVILIDNPWNSAMADQGVLADLSDNVEKWGKWDQFYPGPRASATWKGKIYGVPNESNCLIMYYNVDMLRAAGVAPPTTWEELEAAAGALTKGGVKGFSTAMSKSENAVFVFESLLWQSGADLDTLDSPEGLRALTYLVGLVQKGYLSKECLSWDLRDGLTQLANGRSAICFQGTWDAAWLKKNMKAKWDVALLPAGPAANASNLGGENWSVTASSTNADSAWKLIEFVNQPSQLVPDLVAQGQLPSRKDVASDAAFGKHPLSMFIKQESVAKARVYGANYPQMADALMQAYQGAISGQATPQAALAAAAAKIKPLLSKG
ncbi:MAG: multiple sugar transport system substrate-binding protein [Kribbellaceae bacterium]|jgi:multiple sugar transport system substrate-binding protein|nr:multiple sugar transport system substrate-binding protein [Kribbellaceae bacterium]